MPAMIPVLAVALLAAVYALLLRPPSSTGPYGLCPALHLDAASQAVASAQFEVKVKRQNDDGDDGDVITYSASPCAFSESYWEARAKFRAAAHSAGAQLITRTVVQPDFTMDVAVLRGAGDGVVIHTAGTHGVEGFAGSSVQVSYLRHVAANGGYSDSPTIYLVHAVNPYGMAHFRRTDQDNVDLNRNGLHEDEWKEVLSREPNLAGYEDLTSTVNPRRPPTLFDRYVRTWVQTIRFLVTKGIVPMKRALVAAQYHNPQGIFYGGKSLQPSHKVLWQLLQEEAGDAKGRVTWVDVHTGLGPSGLDTLLAHNEVNYKQVVKWFPGAPDAQNTHVKTDTDGVGAGYDLTVGFVDQFYNRLFPKAHQDTLIFGQEFGTVPNVLVANALVLENAAFNWDPVNQPYWSTYTRDAFYVRTPEWKGSVISRGLTVLTQAIARSSQQ